MIAFFSSSFTSWAQPQFSIPHGLYDEESVIVGMTSQDADAEIRYTIDGSEPTAQSPLYTVPLRLTKTTILRAVEVKSGEVTSAISTASYIFMASVLSQPNNPKGYPDTWGRYTTIDGTAVADYEMDPEMTGDAALRQHIIDGLKDLPILSLVSDKDNFFSHDNDENTGGIYIFTGPPVGDATGHGWTRPANVELFGGPQQHDLSVSCGVRLHGGHGRLAEKNPKHSFRLVFKEKYGPKTLKYPLFGEDEPSKFDQLVLRCHFGNSWQHWMENNRQKAQYTRDVWARRMQRKLGHTSVNALYVHLFLNGMYWGLYNIAERVDDQYGKDHLGGDKEDIDVIKIEEDGGNHLEAAVGSLDAWNEMVEAVFHADDAQSYAKLDTLLDIDNYIDYMLINQYAGNTDWDHHNWYSIRRRGADSQGFRFLCWDSEVILESPEENVLSKNNRDYPTGLFQNLLQNEDFARRYQRRAKQLLADDGLLGEASVVAVWDSLYHTISSAIYDEAARWGDYRRDVHRYSGGAGQLYTVDNQYMKERNRLLSEYFPTRTQYVLSSVLDYVSTMTGIDDWEIPDTWVRLTKDMFHEWNGNGKDSQPLDKAVNVDWNLGKSLSGGSAVAGFANVEYNRYADLSDYDHLVIRGSGQGLRILANRLTDHGPRKEIIVSLENTDRYWDDEYDAIVLPLQELREMPTNEGVSRTDSFLHLHVLKVDWTGRVNVRGIYLIPKDSSLNIASTPLDSSYDGKYYNLQGQEVHHPVKGIYIRNGKKIMVR
ncbi:MAG: CotH kinase family protein [Prevotella sp.]|nr:CotH kinase family protein [Prevotella sp.]